MKKFIQIFILLLAITLMTTASDEANNTSTSDDPSSLEESSGAGSTEESETTTLEPESDESTDTTPLSKDDPLTCIGECPTINGYYSNFLPNERCDRFCQCVYGEPRVISCPDGLHFNAKLDVCDWPQLANCTGEGGVAAPVISNLPQELPILPS